MTENPKTVAEQLDAARDGQEFARVLTGFFTALGRSRDEQQTRDDDCGDE